MYYSCEKYFKPITIQYYTADCVSWVPRLTLLDLRKNWTYERALRTELIRIGGLTVQRRMCKLWAVNGYVHDLDFSDGFMLVYKLQLYFAQFKYIQFIVCHMYLNMGKNIWLQNLVLLDEINWEGGKVVSRL